MSGDSRIDGDAIVGMADLFVGAGPIIPRKTVLVTKRPGSAISGPSPRDAVVVKGGTNKDGFGHAKAAAFNALKAGDKALQAAKKGAAAVKQHAKAVKVGHHSPIVPLALVGHRDGRVVLGAATNKPLTPAQTRAVQRQTAAIAKTAAATKRLDTLSKKAAVAGKAAHDISKKTADAIQNSLKAKWASGRKVGLGLSDQEFIGLYYNYVGSLPDPGNPGYLTDGSMDPAALLGDAAPLPPDAQPMTDPNAAPSMDPGTDVPDLSSQDAGDGVVTAPDGTVLYDPASDPEVVPIPERGGTLSKDEARVTWQNPPDDAIIYDGSKGLPYAQVGSWSMMFNDYNGTGERGGYYWAANRDGHRWIRRMGDGVKYQDLDAVGTDADPSGAAKGSGDFGFGPLVADPRSELAGLQFAIAQQVWFWQGKNAPVWATTETDTKIAASNQKIIQANRTAALVTSAQMAKDLLEQQQAQAKQDAANALAQSAADTQSQIAQQQVEAQTAQLDVQQQKADLAAQQAQAQIAAQQSQADIQAQQAQSQLDAQAQHALVTQADIWNRWAAAHPEEAVQQMQQDMAPGGENYGAGDDSGDGEDGGDYGDDTEDD